MSAKGATEWHLLSGFALLAKYCVIKWTTGYIGLKVTVRRISMPSRKDKPSGPVIDMLSLMEQKQPFEVKWIHYAKLLDNPKNHYSTDGIDALADTIQSFGVLQPLIVKAAGKDVYVITAGHRRKLAAIELVENRKLEKYAFLPCIESEKDEDPTITQLKLNLTNAFNRELSEYDKMFAISELERLFTEAKKKGISIKGKIRDNIGEAMGLGHTQVQKYLTTAKELAKTTSLAEELKQQFQAGMIGITEVYSKIQDSKPDPEEDKEDIDDNGTSLLQPEPENAIGKATGEGPPESAGENKDLQAPTTGQHSEDESLKELKRELNEARKVLNALKKILTIMKIPALSDFVRNFEKELEKVEKKISV
jgi:ParB-like chromosome segregation protein Spo0J